MSRPTTRLVRKAERLERQIRLIRIRTNNLTIEKHLIEMELSMVLKEIKEREEGK